MAGGGVRCDCELGFGMGSGEGKPKSESLGCRGKRECVVREFLGRAYWLYVGSGFSRPNNKLHNKRASLDLETPAPHSRGWLVVPA